MMRATLLGLATVILALPIAGCGQGADTAQAPAAREITRENAREFGDYVVHFNAQVTEMLPPEVARAYGIARSANRAMLNVSVIRKRPGSLGDPVPAQVEAGASNLTGQLKSIEMREIEEGGAIYYIGEVPVANRETLIFDLRVKPDGSNRTFEVQFRQQFYTGS